MCLSKLSITSVNWSGIYVLHITRGHILKLQVHCPWTMEQAGNKTLCCYCWVNIASELVFLFWIFSKAFLLRKATCNLILEKHSANSDAASSCRTLRPSFCSWACLSPISCLVFFVADWISICCYTILQPFSPTISFLCKTSCSPLLSAGVWPHFLQEISFCFSSAL